MELHLSSEAVEAQLFPGINVRKTATKNLESLYSTEEQSQNIKFREEVKKSSTDDDRLSELKYVLSKISDTEDNAQLLGNI